MASILILYSTTDGHTLKICQHLQQLIAAQGHEVDLHGIDDAEPSRLDTYDKIVFDDVRNNALLTAILTYMASEDPEKTSREKAVLPINPRTGQQRQWPEPRSPNRSGGED